MPRKRKQEEVEAAAAPDEVTAEQPSWMNIMFFEDSEGGKHTLGELLTQSDVFPFEVKRGGKTITKHKISYDGIRRIARAAGINKYDFDVLLAPTQTNGMTTYIKVSLTTPEGVFVKLGEAGEINTKGISARYKGVMAEKRGFERAVIEYLGLPNIYGESEFAEEEGGEEASKESFSSKDVEAIAPFVNELNEAASTEALEAVGHKIKDAAKSLTAVQLKKLRDLYSERDTQLKAF